MLDLAKLQNDYLDFCCYQKKLDKKTQKAYRIDLNQFITFLNSQEKVSFDKPVLSAYITLLHKEYKPKSAKRKIASLKAFFNYLEYEEIIADNPFLKLKVKFQEPFLLPRTISVPTLKLLFEEIYRQQRQDNMTILQKKSVLRDTAVLELLFGTGLRISELCSLKQSDINLKEGTLRIYGKGSKERIIYLTNTSILTALTIYKEQFETDLAASNYFFLNRLQGRLSEQSVRYMIVRYAKAAGVSQHLTPHMFRHTFATLLLEEDVDIRYIQQILGHSSIVTTQIYTHVTSNKQKEILTLKHPRMRIG